MYYFALYDENDNRFAFPLKVMREDFYEWQDAQEYETPYEGRTLWGNHYSDFISDQEHKYGVLDVNGSDDEEAFCSYEIEHDKYPEVLENFRQFFVKHGLVDRV